ncbi:heavy metal-binding domain-containing protein [Streptomyces tibetensis]|uniref:Heavy metal-binding domain-containing protein n=1 Tax=Streptomyces tibetensis TaxID=2382123 RepID=A0ABW6ND83_9ACTN
MEVAALRLLGEAESMHVYTTDAVPVAGSPAISEAWLVGKYGQNDEDAVSALKMRAAAEGADAVVGLRMALGGGSVLAYGTAVKFA